MDSDCDSKGFILTKLDNMINWLLNDKILDVNHQFIYHLKQYRLNFDTFVDKITVLSKFSDTQGKIDDKLIETFLKYYDIDMNKLDLGVINKVKRYISFFIVSITQLL
jgi:hypothetical protein